MKRLSAWFLALAMALSLVQVPAYANEVSDQNTAQPVEETENVNVSTEEEVISPEETEESATIAENKETEESVVVSTEASSEETYLVETESEESEAVLEEESDSTYYVQMNIPYSAFYAAENVDEQVDVITTATENKFKGTTGLAKGTYNDGTNIVGVTYPVAMNEATYEAVKDNKVADDTDLGTAASYAFKDLETEPTAYKTLTYNEGTYTFSDVTAPEKSSEGLSITEVTTTGGYGNYQITLDGVKTAGTINNEDAVIYGLIIETADGKRYPMYMLENIWLGTRVENVELAWCVQNAPVVKKNHGQSEEAFHQYDMNGATITGVKLITDIGVYNVSTNETLPTIDMSNSLTVADANVLDGSTTFEANLKADFAPEYSVENIEGATVEDGKITIPSGTAPGTYTLTAKDTKGVYAPVSATFTLSAYALVNIPYSYFYKADLNNDVDVDVFTSATKSKAAMPNLAGKVYHTEDNSEITGVTYPAIITSTTGLTAVDADALATAASWSYALLDEEPNQAKVLTVTTSGRGPTATTTYSVGEVKGNVTTYTEADGIEGTLKTQTNYGDYQLDFTGLFTETDREGNVTKEGKIPADDYIYGAIVTTNEGSSYGMRGLENIWKGELAWCTGLTTAVHNCPTSSAHYVAMMGQTISSVTFLTTSGIYSVNDLSIYVPVKSADISVSVADAHVSDGKATIAASLPEDYSPVYTVNMEGATVQDGQIIFPDNVNNSQYTLTVSDENNKYADVTATFEVKADKLPVTYDSAKKALVKAADASDADFEEYIAAITSVKVDGTNYNKNGMRGAAGTVIVKDDGSIDTTLDLFATAKVYSVTVPVTGYDELSFSVDLRKETVISAADVVKTYGDAPFAIGASASSAATLTYTSSNTSVATVSADGVVTICNAGTAVITVSAPATDSALAASKNVVVTVNKAAQPMKLKVSSKSYKKSKVKKKAQKFNIGVSNAAGTVTYRSNSKKVSVSKSGKVTVKKGTKKGTYKITVTAAGNANYNAGTKTVVVKVK